jgi:hypothetical protein
MSILVENLKQIDGVARSGFIEIPLQVTWSIPNFCRRSDGTYPYHNVESREKNFTINITGGQETADVSVKICYSARWNKIDIEGKVELPSWIDAYKAYITVGQLDRTGSEIMWPQDRPADFIRSHWTGRKFVNFKSFLDKKRVRMYNPLPDGQLTILIKGKIFALAEILAATCTNPDLMCQKENIMCDVKLDSFVDLGSASVVLVFEDGEERCHTFLLAAREDCSTVF